MTTEAGLISIIVPVYNIEKYIAEALDSALRQTYPHFELIVIDDGSKDGSGAILDRYAQMDSRVRVFHTENKGVSAARNLGIAQAQGEWLFFLDGDDWLEDHALETLLRYSDGMDMVIGDYEGRWQRLTEIDTPVVYSMDNMSPESWRELYLNKVLFTVWNRLLRTEKVTCRFIEELSYGEDTAFVAQQIQSLEKICKVPDVTYHYRAWGGSVTEVTAYKRFENMRQFFNIAYEVYQKIPHAVAEQTTEYVKRLYYHLAFLKEACGNDKELWKIMAGAWLQEASEDYPKLQFDYFYEQTLDIWNCIRTGDLDQLWDRLNDPRTALVSQPLRQG